MNRLLSAIVSSVQSPRQLVLPAVLALMLSVGAGGLALAVGGNDPATTEKTGPFITLDDVESGTLLFKAKEGGKYLEAPRVATDVKMDVAGPVIRAKVTQRFKNPSNAWIEGVYAFPLPENSGVDTLKIIIGDRVIEGKIKEREEARAIYEAAKAEGKKAGLMEQERPNLFTTSVANIGPGETVSIQIEYQDKAQLNESGWQIRFPMVVAPRYAPVARGSLRVAENKKPSLVSWLFGARSSDKAARKDPVPDRDKVTPPVMNPVNEPVGSLRLPVSFSVNLKSGFALGNVSSPSHKLVVMRPTPNTATVSFADGAVPANRDVILNWTPQDGLEPQASLFSEVINGQTYYLAMIAPPTTASKVVPKPRETVFVIDNSGSMSGTSMDQAKKALLFALGRLKPTDKFNVVRFDDTFELVFPRTVAASAENVTFAKDFVGKLEANGGTEILEPMKAALIDQTPQDDAYVRQVVFITDGAISNENEVLEAVTKGVGRSRVFTVAIGSAPNTFFLGKAARMGRGNMTLISDVEQVEKQGQKLFLSLERPAMTDIEASLPKGMSMEQYPSPLPDLYFGDPLVVVAKASGTTGTLRLTGKVAGQAWTKELPLSGAQPSVGLGKLWGRAKIENIEEGNLTGVDPVKVDKEVLDTALAFNLVSRRTSLVAVDVTPSRPKDAPVVKSDVPLMLPSGWDFEKVFGPDVTGAINAVPAIDPAILDQLQASLTDPAEAKKLAAADDGLDLEMGASPWDQLVLQGLALMLLGGLAVFAVRQRRSA